jgi:GMP synthase (glutamine-hydrolysing)
VTGSRPLVILKTGSAFDELGRAQGDFEDWFVRGLEVPREAVEVVDTRSPELPATSWPWGVVVTGSPEMVTDRAEWMDRAGAWLRELVESGTPVLGVCFGHQLLAHALGGVVDWNVGGSNYGTVEVQQLLEARADPLLGALPPTFAAHSAHSQSVRVLPPEAVALARTEDVAVQAARFGPRAWGVQFHPEFSESIARAYVRRNARWLADQGRDPEAILAGVAPSPAGRLLARFGEWFRDGAA